MNATEKLLREMTLAVIEKIAAAEKPSDLYSTFKCVSKGKILPESSGYFWRQVQSRFFRRLDTKKDDWRNWTKKARRYLAPPPPNEMEATLIATKSSEPTATAMPVKQTSLF